MSSRDTIWKNVPLQDLDVTRGNAYQTASGFLTVVEPKVRAQLREGLQSQAQLRFRYRSVSTRTEPNESGQVITQIGLKLRTMNTCNLLYVMWVIEPVAEESLVIKLKRNPGMSRHLECLNNGYRTLGTVLMSTLGTTATDLLTHR